MTLEVCGDGRFEIIEKAKQAIIESTNIETSPEEMAVLDNILFRCWQMGWLDKYDNQPNTDADTISRDDAVALVIKAIHGTDNKEIKEYLFDGLRKQMWSLPSAEQVTGKLNNPDDSLLTGDSDACKEQNSKLDLISRQDALAEFQDGRDVYDIMESIEELPSAPDSRQRGEWVRLEREENVYDLHGVPTWGVNYMCDKCGFITTAIQDHFGQYKWCPSCGADMRGGGDET